MTRIPEYCGLQGMGSLLIVLFTLGLVHFASAAHRLAGWITMLAGATMLNVSLAEFAFYRGAGASNCLARS
jgi:hypothetical protein